ncbi:hypothetical protein Pmani_029362 [Petrolisthes manimaculis]|uniref:Secreted protein n=1 Tax=Petrolisthes manimaculis TaxID=1843537 RepID=A0AAE1TX34_9EUCA|nr:hypothetical protein Pmani_029362 [Petrolisthes manimaculis]
MSSIHGTRLQDFVITFLKRAANHLVLALCWCLLGATEAETLCEVLEGYGYSTQNQYTFILKQSHRGECFTTFPLSPPLTSIPFSPHFIYRFAYHHFRLPSYSTRFFLLHSVLPTPLGSSYFTRFLLLHSVLPTPLGSSYFTRFLLFHSIS